MSRISKLISVEKDGASETILFILIIKKGQKKMLGVDRIDL